MEYIYVYHLCTRVYYITCVCIYIYVYISTHTHAHTSIYWQIDRWTNGWKGWMNEWMYDNEWMNGWMDGWMDRSIHLHKKLRHCMGIKRLAIIEPIRVQGCSCSRHARGMGKNCQQWSRHYDILPPIFQVPHCSSQNKNTLAVSERVGKSVDAHSLHTGGAVSVVSIACF